ncbi:MAG: RNA-binding S4 domain-containing protein [Bacteroidales bacterium]|jgi:ribosome-associated heat shock protein Hsp15|nr:RNA-binding S4 domain-containing protein [Bacteroidales bacterium]
MDAVRIDKFLWAIRVYKTRTDATEACKGSKVTLNGVDVKPSREVKAGDRIGVRKGPVSYTFKVLAPLEKRVGAKDVAAYAENLTPQSELDKLHAPVETFFIRRDRGAGRPTKKDRREMDSLYDSFFVDEIPDED